MKYRTRIFALLLAGAMIFSLAACTGGENADDAPPSDSAEPSSDSILPDDFVVDTSVEDLCLATAGIPGDFTLFTVNGVPVTARAYLYWMGYNISYLSSYYGDIDWTVSDSDTPFADYVKEDSLNAASYYALLAAKTKELGCELTQEQIDELDSTFAFTILMMGGEEAFEDELRKAGLDYDTIYQINAAPYYYEQLLDALYADRPTDEEMAAYIEDNDLLCAKHILLMTVDPTTYEPLDEATIAEQKATAESLLAQLQASTDLTADFDALMNEYSEDPGLASYPDGYTFTAGAMDEAFEAATRALEFGQISGLVESSFGYHIILRLDPDTENNRTEFRADLLDIQMQDWLDEAEIVFTDEYEALDPQLFFEKFSAYQDAFAAEASAETSTDDSTDTSPDVSADPEGISVD